MPEEEVRQSQTSNQSNNRSNLMISQIEELKREPIRLSDQTRELQRRILNIKEMISSAENEQNKKNSNSSNQPEDF